MKLTNLEKTLTVCIKYHEKQGNKVKVAQLEDQLKKVNEKKLEDEQTHNLYK